MINRIAKLIAEDPDIVVEDACPLCGSQGDAMFTSFQCSNRKCPNYHAGTAANILKQHYVSYVSLDMSNIEEVFSHIKGYGGAVTYYDARHDQNKIRLSVVFDNFQDANEFTNDKSIPMYDAFGPEYAPFEDEDVKEYDSGEAERNFVREFDLS